MIEVKQSIDLQRAFSCVCCKTIALIPLVASCCQYIFCKNCPRPSICPKCKKTCIFRQSPLLKQIYSSITLKCKIGCNATLNLGQVGTHKQICPEALITCPYCKEQAKLKMLPDHIGIKHQEECSRILTEYHKIQKVKSVVPVSIPKIQPFKYFTTVQGAPYICKFGRYVCHKNYLSSNELMTELGHSICSPQTGSCNTCMGKDIIRLGLPKKHLINVSGIICLYTVQNKIACGCKIAQNSVLICNEMQQCNSCRYLLKLINEGMYRTYIL